MAPLRARRGNVRQVGCESHSSHKRTFTRGFSLRIAINFSVAATALEILTVA